jgi:hypothetical protein
MSLAAQHGSVPTPMAAAILVCEGCVGQWSRHEPCVGPSIAVKYTSRTMDTKRLTESRERFLKLAEDELISLERVAETANAQLLLKFSLESVPINVAAHIQEAHDSVRPILGRFSATGQERPVLSGMGYLLTPRKVLRRIVDHALDHANQIDQWTKWQKSGIVPNPTDGWTGSSVTLPDDLLPIGEQELAAWLWRVDMSVGLLKSMASNLNDAELDWQPLGNSWSLRKVIHHVAVGEK